MQPDLPPASWLVLNRACESRISGQRAAAAQHGLAHAVGNEPPSRLAATRGVRCAANCGTLPAATLGGGRHRLGSWEMSTAASGPPCSSNKGASAARPPCRRHCAAPAALRPPSTGAAARGKPACSAGRFRSRHTSAHSPRTAAARSTPNSAVQVRASSSSHPELCSASYAAGKVSGTRGGVACAGPVTRQAPATAAAAAVAPGGGKSQ